jgi:hypothetical protein
MNVKSDSYLFTVPSLGLPVFGLILLGLFLIVGVNALLAMFTINTKKATVVPGGIGDE